MLVQDARNAARDWVMEHLSAEPGFIGAYTAGSTNWLPDDAEIDPASDVDTMVVLDLPERRDKIGKVNAAGALLDVSFLSSVDFTSADGLLGNFQLGPGFWTGHILADPSGRLTSLRADIGDRFAQRRWVQRRREHVHANEKRYFSWLRQAKLFHDQVICWLFGTSMTTQALLVAGLRNPTVRKRYAAARDLLVDHDRLDVYETLLRHLGCDQWSAAQTERHLTALAETFETVSAIGKTHFFFSSELTELARPVAVGGSQSLIASGRHREAVFWMAVTQARCQTILYHDGTEEQRAHHAVGFMALLADLGVATHADLQRRADDVERSLPEIDAVADAIMAATPEIVDA